MSATHATNAVHTVIWDFVLMHLRPNGPSLTWVNAVEELNDLLSLPEDPEDPEFQVFDLAERLLGTAECVMLRALWDNAVVSESHVDAYGGLYALQQMDLAKRVVPKVLRLFADTPEQQSPYWRLTATGQRLADLLYT